uniref:F-actin-capping protein subunit beta n=1 Tax=Ganoderma boninense TaxID=34458 RepID=A0A5K1JVF3_9APHY|nr:F-actin-capping protein subunit beta [Ganoderma boninense]
MTATYPTQQEAALVAAAEKLMVETMARYDPSHDAHHVQRVRKTALQLARTVSAGLPEDRQPDLLTVELAALLHDVLDKKYVSAEQAADPYAFFVPFFEKTASEGGLDLVEDGRARIIARIIDNVSWTTEKKRLAAGQIEDWHRQCVELHCVQDADRLDAIGAFGILRCAAFSAATNRALHVPKSDPAYDATAIGHFYDKLLHIRERLKTEPGKKLADKRHQLMLDFLHAVDEEYEVQA